MAVRLGKDERLGNFIAVGKYFRQFVLECLDDIANLAGIDDVLIQLLAFIVEFVFQLLPAFFAREALANVNVFPGENFRALSGDFRFMVKTS